MLPDQQARLDEWLPGHAVVRDHTWGLVDRDVVEVCHKGVAYLVKAGGPSDGHMAREIRAHERWLEPWTSRGLVPPLVAADVDLRLLVTRFLPGHLVQGDRAADDPATYHQAGVLLALLHDQPGDDDPDLERRENARCRRWLDSEHRIAPDVVRRVRGLLAAWDEVDVVARRVPTHGDWHPRNWIVDDAGVVRAIDLGRADLRPAATDLLRLASREFRGDPALEAAFLEGYGTDPRASDPAAWHRMRLREAVSTAAWAHQVGDEAFEQHGHGMVEAALADLDSSH
jgi:aminoglycoside phosphotransferase